MKTIKFKQWFYLIIIVLIYWLGASFFYESGKFTYIVNTNKPIRYLVHFGMLFLIGCFGYLGLTSLVVNWIKDLWIIIYAFFIFSFFLFGIIDYFFVKLNNPIFRNLITCLHLFFASPVPYGIMLMIAKKVNQTKPLTSTSQQ